MENFSDDVLNENGRAHLSAEIYRAWEWIQAAQFPNVNIDLIAGMVGETWDNWQDNIRRTIELSPDSVTIYQMELPFNTVYSQGHPRQQDRDAGRRLAHQTGLGQLCLRRTAGGRVSRLQRLHAGQRSGEGEFQLSRQPVAWCRHAGDRDRQFRARFGRPLPEPAASGISTSRRCWSRHELPIGRALRPTPHQRLVREMILQLKHGWLDAQLFPPEVRRRDRGAVA